MAKDMAGLFLCGLGFEDGEFSRFGQPETRLGCARRVFRLPLDKPLGSLKTIGSLKLRKQKNRQKQFSGCLWRLLCARA